MLLGHLVLSANVDGFVGHGHFLGRRLAALLLLRVPHEHDEGKHINAKHQPRQIETVSETATHVKYVYCITHFEYHSNTHE